MKEEDLKAKKRKRIVRVPPPEKERATPESLERLRQKAEEKGWIKK